MRLDERGLGEYTDRFDHDAFRHETATNYLVDNGSADWVRWQAGELGPAPDEVRPWSEWLRAQRARPTRPTIRRVRVIYAHPLTEHLRFEIGYQYRANTAAGEDIRILDLTEQPRPDGMLDDEFWMMDGVRAALMAYDKAGRFTAAETIEGLGMQVVRRAAAAAWDTAEPLEVWWARHDEYHRARV
jgi:hypothetical protein